MTSRPFALLTAGALVAGAAYWAATADDGSATSSSGAASPWLEGPSLFRAKGCAGCHTGPGTTSSTGIAPDLVDAAAWAGTRIPGTSAEDYLRQSIVDPQAFTSPAADTWWEMPTLALSDAELDALVAYLLDTGR